MGVTKPLSSEQVIFFSRDFLEKKIEMADTETQINELKAALALMEASKAADDSNLNQFFLLIMGALVMFMQAGFAFLEAGSVRSKNVVNILIKNVLDCFLGAITYWAFGYAFAYGDVSPDHPQAGANKFIGFKYFFSIYHNDDMKGGDVFFAEWFFQFVFAATAATIVSGAVAERTQFGAYLSYSTFITGFIYPVVSHWGWSGTGWLQNHGIESMAKHEYDADGALVYGDAVGYVDFAGSGLVHCTGGIAALMGAAVIGARIGKFSSDGTKQVHIPGHSVPIAALGAFILFLGFLAFNGGSELAIVGSEGHGQAVAVSFMNTILGGASGSLFAIVLNYVYNLVRGETAYWSLLTCINGGLAGMVSMCAGCNVLSQGAAFGIGGMAGITLWWTSLLLKKFGVDDPLDAFAVHYGGGLVGVLATPVFMPGGVIDHVHCKDQEAKYIADYGDAATGFACDHFEYKVWAWNLCGLVAITVWAGGLSLGVFLLLKVLNLLRVDRDIEIRGLDIRKHGEPAYPTRAYGHGWEKEGDYDVTGEKTALETVDENGGVENPHYDQAAE